MTKQSVAIEFRVRHKSRIRLIDLPSDQAASREAGRLAVWRPFRA